MPIPALKDATDPLDIEPSHGNARALPETTLARGAGRLASAGIIIALSLGLWVLAAASSA